MARTINIKTLHQKKFITFPFTGEYHDVFGEPERSGVWIIYGREKNGKTSESLTLAEYLSGFEKTWYVSAEEGTSKAFVDNVKRAGLDPLNKNLQFLDYLPITELSEKLNQRRAAKVVFIDNVTIYKEELRSVVFKKLIKDHPNKLFVFVAHEERNEPDGAAGKLIKKLSQIIIRVQGLKCFVTGRCPGGVLTIDESKSILYHGTEINQN